MIMHETTFQYLNPTDEQMRIMADFRAAFAELAEHIESSVPESRYRSLTITRLEEAAMWCNKAITRHGDGKPRE